MIWLRRAGNKRDETIYSSTYAFLNRRLESREAINWALKLEPSDRAQREAILVHLHQPNVDISEPWSTAWQLIEESWRTQPYLHSPTENYQIKRRIESGETSASLVTAIVDFVAARLEIESFDKYKWNPRKVPKQPKTFRDLFYTHLTSNQLTNLKSTGLDAIKDIHFLDSLARCLEAAVDNGVDIDRRISALREGGSRLLSNVRRVYYVGVDEDGDGDPDNYSQGIAPSIKVLHAVVERLAHLKPDLALKYIRRWRVSNSAIYIRLWAALARNANLVPSDDVSEFLLNSTNEQFWDVTDFPEIAELRTKRFKNLTPIVQKKVIARIIKLPPRGLITWEKERTKKELIRTYWALRELRRIEGVTALPKGAKLWLMARIEQYPELREQIDFDEGFPQGVRSGIVLPKPDNKYDALRGKERLDLLEVSLGKERSHWDNDSARGAQDWIREGKNTFLILDDLEQVISGGKAYPRIWETFSWIHTLPNGQFNSLPEAEQIIQVKRVLNLLAVLPKTTIIEAIEGISNWLSSWGSLIAKVETMPKIWLKIWPIAVKATNKVKLSSDKPDLGIVAKGGTEDSPMDLDTLNTPVGRMVNLLVSAWQAVEGGQAPFAAGSITQIMRDVVIAAPGRAGLITKSRMIELIDHFIAADSEWTKKNLLPPLLNGNNESIPLWRALARRTRSHKTLVLLGESLLERTTDPRLAREARKSLVFTVVIDCLWAFHEKTEPAISTHRIQQMLRSIGDEERAHAANAVYRFIRDNTKSTKKSGDGKGIPSEKLFRNAAKIFLETVWPQERSLSTPGISHVLAGIPAASGNEFANAVHIIERFLVPCKCWSLLDYGLYGNEDSEEGGKKISRINTPTKARALLTLIHRTVGATEESVIPHDLSEALAQIKQVAPALEAVSEFRRLAAAARW